MGEQGLCAPGPVNHQLWLSHWKLPWRRREGAGGAEEKNSMRCEAEEGISTGGIEDRDEEDDR